MMKRQKFRKLIMLISFLLFPLTIYYFSPYLIICGAAEGIITGSFVVFGIMLITSIFFGRAFCGWLCPAGGLQECMINVTDKKARGGRFNWIKYIIWLPWVSSIAILGIAGHGFSKLDFFYQTTNGISVANPQAYFVYYGVISLVVVLCLLTGKRGFCHYSCWMAPFMIFGTKIGELLHLPALKLEADKSKCISCKQCSKKCSMSLEVDEMVQKSCMSNSECILCGECVDVCPKSAIKYKFKR